jgi:RNA polymerase sigma-70 factor (ECF subfamily)
VSARNPIYGSENVDHFFLVLTQKMSPNFVSRLLWVNGQPGIIGYEDGQPVTVLSFEIFNRRIQVIHTMRNPDKLQRVPPLEQTG